ncbi:MAG: tail sheath stabilizer and completion protein [Candidatus Pacebacteria bacterium]|jgi:hypothetical protein|nr:tail sheath stabilizer and completion protein [Candidatus Paceibacterota bacterium]
MLGNTFYHETLRKCVVGFGTLFNDIHITRKDSSGNVTQSMKIPLAYGAKQKFLTRLREDPNITKTVAITLPRIGFEIGSITYDGSRKLNKIQKVKKAGTAGNKVDTQYMPVPYNIDFELYAMSKNSDDALQIVEQILPYFQPDYTITINDIVQMSSKRDVPIILNGISYEDNYEGDFTERRAIIYTLTFTAKCYLYGPVISGQVVTKVQVDQYTDSASAAPKREQRLTVTPTPSTASLEDDFGFNETSSFFEDAKNYNVETGQDE